MEQIDHKQTKMEYASLKRSDTRPRIIIHGGAGNILRENLPEAAYKQYRRALLDIVELTKHMVLLSGGTALDAATFAVTQLENNPLFNAGLGAVFTTAGKHELEASVMVSRGFRKRGVGVMGVSRVRNPILLAKEMLLRGESADGGGAKLHNQLHGKICEELAAKWDLQLVRPSYFWTRRRWDEHRRGLGLSHDDETYERAKREADSNLTEASGYASKMSDGHCEYDDPSWDGHEYLPQGTVGAVVLDMFGTLCVATSTGGLTNKLPGRIGDTPTLGAGFWAEEWQEKKATRQQNSNTTATLPNLGLQNLIPKSIGDCLGKFSGYEKVPPHDDSDQKTSPQTIRVVAMSGTGNGDSFLRTNAARTAAAIARFDSSSPQPLSLQQAVTRVAGPGGILQESAGDRWGSTGEGEGGMIGIDLIEGKGSLVADFNCGGMFRAWLDEENQAHMAVFRGEYK